MKILFKGTSFAGCRHTLHAAVDCYLSTWTRSCLSPGPDFSSIFSTTIEGFKCLAGFCDIFCFLWTFIAPNFAPPDLIAIELNKLSTFENTKWRSHSSIESLIRNKPCDRSSFSRIRCIPIDCNFFSTSFWDIIQIFNC